MFNQDYILDSILRKSQEKYVIDLHLEDPKQESFDDSCNLIEKINKKSKAKVIVSITPDQLEKVEGTHHQDVMFSGGQKEAIRQMSEDNLIEIAMQGYRHHCLFCFGKNTYVDTFHEFGCLYNKLPFGVQRTMINEGKNIHERTFGKFPRIFTSPNHLYDENTLGALIENGFEYTSELNFSLDFPVEYELNNKKIIIIPESKDSRPGGGMIYLHSDKIKDFMNFIDSRKKNIVSLEDYLESAPRSSISDLKTNMIFKNTYKYCRDLSHLPSHILSRKKIK